jgi:SH3-like domain-containing protein
MPFNWEEFIALAKYLNNQTSSGTLSGDLRESADRTAVSRIFFAAHHLAKNYIVIVKKDNRAFQNGTSEYGAVNSYFKRSGYKSPIYKYLTDLREWRRICDHDDEVTNLDYIKSEAFKTVNKFIELLKSK